MITPGTEKNDGKEKFASSMVKQIKRKTIFFYNYNFGGRFMGNVTQLFEIFYPEIHFVRAATG